MTQNSSTLHVQQRNRHTRWSITVSITVQSFIIARIKQISIYVWIRRRKFDLFLNLMLKENKVQLTIYIVFVRLAAMFTDL